MRIAEYKNGVVTYRDMTPEEEAEMRTEEIPVEQSREAELEARVSELEAALDALLTGVTE